MIAQYLKENRPVLSRSRNHLRKASTLLIMIASIGATRCNSGTVTTPVVKKITFITDSRHLTMNPLVVDQASDTGFIVAGTSATFDEAWAAKTDATGNIVWQYVRNIPPEETPMHISRRVEFRGTASMPDGSTYLCGSLFDGSGGSKPAMMTHVSSHGDLISENMIRPRYDVVPTHYSIQSCTYWNGGVIGLGTAVNKDRSYFWLFFMGSDGKIVWENTFDPLPPESRSLDPEGQVDKIYTFMRSQPFSFETNAASFLFNDSPNRVYFSVSDNLNTEILSVDSAGKVHDRAAFTGPALLIKSNKHTRDIDVFRANPHVNSDAKIERLDEKLAQNKTLEMGPSPLRLVEGIYALSDDSLLLIGLANGVGRHVPTSTFHAGPLLKDGSELKIILPNTLLGLTGNVAISDKSTDDYLLCMPMFAKNQKSGEQDFSAERENGAAFIFLGVK